MHLLQPRLLWKYEFLCCFMGRISSAHLEELTQEIADISRMRRDFNSWPVRSSKALSAALRHNNNLKLGRYLEATLEDLHTHTLDWRPRKFFSFLSRPQSSDLRSVLRLGLRRQRGGDPRTQPHSGATSSPRNV